MTMMTEVLINFIIWYTCGLIVSVPVMLIGTKGREINTSDFIALFFLSFLGPIALLFIITLAIVLWIKPPRK